MEVILLEEFSLVHDLHGVVVLLLTLLLLLLDEEHLGEGTFPEKTDESY